jgi:hypothetical protein
LSLNDIAYLYLGSATGLATTPVWTRQTSQFDSGANVAGAGDVNGDGYADVLVGEPEYSSAPLVDEGHVFLYQGTASGLSMLPAWEVDGDQNFAILGFSVASAGDVNGDGYADIVLGAIGYDSTWVNEGRAYVYLGSASGPFGLPWVANGGQPNAELGYSVATAGDVNGDGYADVLIGAPFYDTALADAGRVFLYEGSGSGLNLVPSWATAGNQESQLYGTSVATAGDVNGDGYADVVIGAPGYSNGQTSEGAAYLYTGSVSGLPNAALWTGEGDQDYAGYGTSVATAGDVNGDGYSDVMVGVPQYEAAFQFDQGRALVYLGSASTLETTADWAASSDFDVAVSSAGDVNGDGYADVLVGVPSYDNGQGYGRVYLYLGSAAGLLTGAAWSADGDQTDTALGSSVASAGDVNGDGYSDVIIGASDFDTPGNHGGRAFLYLGSPTGLATTPAWTVQSNQASDRFGSSVASAGDVNGDGLSDVLVGSYLFDNGQLNEGKVFLYLGSPSGLQSSPAWTAEGNQAGAGFGLSVAAAGDVNGDGYSDVLVGAFRYDNGQTDEGAAFVYLGTASGLSPFPAWVTESNSVGEGLGYSVATAGDVNGDGYADVILGDLAGFAGPPERAFIFLGSSSGLSANPAWTVTGTEQDADFGSAVSSAGDVNGDGYSDVLVGASYSAGGAGQAYLYLGSASGPSTVPAWTQLGLGIGGFGNVVAPAADVNGDGFADVLIGSFASPMPSFALAYYGNMGGGLDRSLRQMRSDGLTPIALLGKSDSPTAFNLRERGITPAGRGKIRLQWEAKPLGAPFNAAAFGNSSLVDTGAPGAGGSAATFNQPVDLPIGSYYHWRSRILSSDPFFPRSPWMSFFGNHVTETKLSTGGCSDVDGDGYGFPGDPTCTAGAGDCNDLNVAVWGTPGEVVNLLFTNPTTLSWSPPASPGASVSSLVYDTLLSTTPTGFQTGSCVESDDGPNTTATYAGDPAPGQVFYYLVRAQDSCAFGMGPLGTDSSGVPRAGRTCP